MLSRKNGATHFLIAQMVKITAGEGGSGLEKEPKATCCLMDSCWLLPFTLTPGGGGGGGGGSPDTPPANEGEAAGGGGVECPDSLHSRRRLEKWFTTFIREIP